MDTLFTSTCPDCGGPITFHFALLTNIGVGVLCFAKCAYCFHHGDIRSARLFVQVDEAVYLWAAHNGLCIINYKVPDTEEDEEENILDELDDEEEPSNIGFRPENDPKRRKS